MYAIRSYYGIYSGVQQQVQASIFKAGIYKLGTWYKKFDLRRLVNLVLRGVHECGGGGDGSGGGTLRAR